MKIAITPMKNPAVDWDITVSVGAEGGALVGQVILTVNGFPEPIETLNPPQDEWEKTYSQKGVYPGENKAEVTVTSDAGDQTRKDEDLAVTE